MGGRKAQGGHLPLCGLGQGLSTSELGFLSHRADGAMPLLPSPWLVGKEVIVVATRQPPGWLGGGAGLLYFPSTPPESHHK